MNLKDLKDIAVKNCHYELAFELRGIEKSDWPDEEKLAKAIELCLAKQKEYQEAANIIGDTYPIDDQAHQEATTLFDKANSIRNEADVLLEKADEITTAAFKLLRNSNKDIPASHAFVYLREQRIIVIVKPKL